MMKVRKIQLLKDPTAGIPLLPVGYYPLLVIVMVSMLSLVVIIWEVFFEQDNAFDLRIFEYLSFRVNDRNTAVMQFFTFLGSYMFLIPAYLGWFALYWFAGGQKSYVARMLTITVGNVLVMFGLKYIFSRQRPLVPLITEVPGLSFPSGHAFLSLTFFAMIIFAFAPEIAVKWQRLLLQGILMLVILLVGFSRLYLRLHYATDVIAGFCFGFLSMVLLTWLTGKLSWFERIKLQSN